jgi:type I restriction enzyme, S subunit
MEADHVPYDHPWEEVLLGEVASVIVGGTPSTAVPAYWDGTVPWMASGDIHLRRITDVPGRITELGLARSAATMVDPPSVAVALAGQGKTRGTAALVEVALCTNQSVALIRPGHRLDARYLFHNLAARYDELRARSSGEGRAGLTKSIIEAVPIPLPPLEDQRRIARVLDETDALIDDTEAYHSKLLEVRIGLARDLLSGSRPIERIA